MYMIRMSRLILIKVVLWVTVYFSSLALLYHTRWFIPFLLNPENHHVVPMGEIPAVWFIVQICTNLIFLYVSWQLIRLFRRYGRTGYFDSGSLTVLNGIIWSCLGLAVLGAVKITINNFNEVNIGEWTSAVSILNLIARSFVRLLILNSPQTIYLLLATLLWAIKQFVKCALEVKLENETFI